MTLVIAHEWHSGTSFNGARLYFCVHCGRYIGHRYAGEQGCVWRKDEPPTITADDFIDQMNISNYIRRVRTDVRTSADDAPVTDG